MSEDAKKIESSPLPEEALKAISMLNLAKQIMYKLDKENPNIPNVGYTTQFATMFADCALMWVQQVGLTIANAPAVMQEIKDEAIKNNTVVDLTQADIPHAFRGRGAK